MSAPVMRQDFEPRPYQRGFMRYLERGGKRAMWVMHRRAGKDLTALHQTCRMMARRRGAYWHVFPTGEQGRKAIWEGFTRDGKRIMESVFPTSIRKSPRAFLPSSEMVVELANGSLWRLMGSDKMEVVGAGPVGVVFSEFALSKPKTWDLVRPMLRENDGWAAFITTPRGNNHAKKLFDVAQADPSWFCEIKTLLDTRAYDPEETIAEERASGMPEALIRQEYLCDWTAANVGSVFGDLLEALEKRERIGEFAHPKDGVQVNFDLGVGDSAALWFWRLNKHGVPDILDWYESSGRPAAHYMDHIEASGYDVERLWLPHDGLSRTFQTGVTTRDLFQARFPGKVAIVPRTKKPDQVQAGRWLLQQPIRIHERCAEGMERLKAYRYAWDEDKKTFSPEPVHDWASHSADGFMYLAQVVQRTERRLRVPPAPEPVELRPHVLTLDDFEELPSTRKGRV